MEKLAKTGKPTVVLPKMFKGEKNNFNFTYSGLKTAVINYRHNREQAGGANDDADIACSFQSAALDVLVEKTMLSSRRFGVKTVTAGGGVVANGYLRAELEKSCKSRKIKLYLPPKGLCTDNAAMIGAEGYVQYMRGNFAGLDLNAEASVDL